MIEKSSLFEAKVYAKTLSISFITIVLQFSLKKIKKKYLLDDP